jgi:esterase
MRRRPVKESAGVAKGEALDHLRLAAELAGVDAADPSLPEDKDVVVNGLRLHYLDWGGEGRDVVFLHGGALTAHTWDVVCLALRRDFRCLALDQRGHGDSEWVPAMEYDTEHHVGDLAGFIEHLRLDRPVLVGQSMGGLNAMTYAADHGDRLAGLVLIDVAPKVSRAGTKRIADFVLAPAELDSIDEFVERAQAFNPARDPRPLRRSLLHNLRELPDGRWTWKYDRRHLSPEVFERIQARLPQLLDKLDTVTCRTLVVKGADSDLLSEADAVEFAAALPHARWTSVENAGHTVQGDNPRGLAEILQTFLAETEPG